MNHATLGELESYDLPKVLEVKRENGWINLVLMGNFRIKIRNWKSR